MSITYKIMQNGDRWEAINWNEVAEILNNAGLSDYGADKQKIIFQNSYVAIFVYDADRIIGVGRAISDGVCQAAVYNIALCPEYHGMGIGGTLIKKLLAHLEGQNIILYTDPPHVPMYEKEGFIRSKTAMCIFTGSEEKLNHMKKAGFLLPKGFRFVNEYEWE